MGYWAEPDVVITNAIGPGPRAMHHPRGFVPDAQYQEHEVARFYEESGRSSTYLGDWHTHPGATTRLSRRDKRTLQLIARSSEARCSRPLMAVLAGGKSEWDADFWYLKGRGLLASLLRRSIARFNIVVYS